MKANVPKKSRMMTTSERVPCSHFQRCRSSYGAMTTTWVRLSPPKKALRSSLAAEMSLNIDTIHATAHSHCSEDLKLARRTQASAKETAVIDGLSVLHSNEVTLADPSSRTQCTCSSSVWASTTHDNIPLYLGDTCWRHQRFVWHPRSSHTSSCESCFWAQFHRSSQCAGSGIRHSVTP